jgi:predicted dinucleotide-binding enzyme
MDVTIIGTGNMARGIATRALAGGNVVTLLGHQADDAAALASELDGDVGTGTVGDPVGSRLVVLAVPYGALRDVVGAYGDGLAGHVLVDITNPVDFQTFARLSPEGGSAAAELAGMVPDAAVVKAFNTTFAGTLVDGKVGGQPLDVLIASDDDDATRLVTELVESGGMRPVVAGPLARAAELEAVGYLHMAVQEGMGTGFGSAVKLIA